MLVVRPYKPRGSYCYHIDQITQWGFENAVLKLSYFSSLSIHFRPTLKIFWFAIYRLTHHFTPDPIIFFLDNFEQSFFCFYKNKQFSLQTVSFSWTGSKKRKKIVLPTTLPTKFWVGQQQTNIFLRLALFLAFLIFLLFLFLNCHQRHICNTQIKITYEIL